MFDSSANVNTSVDLRPFRPRTDVHLARKLWHMGTGLAGLAWYFTEGNAQLAARSLLVLSLTVFALEFVRLRTQWLNRMALVLMRPFMREHEKTSVSGLPFYALGVSLSLFLYSEPIAILSIFFLVFSDPISSFVGINWGTDKILPNKSLQGSMAGFVTCYLLALSYGLAFSDADWKVVPFAIAAGAIGSLSELLSSFNIDDNLTIPVISGAGLTVLNEFLGVF